MQDLHRAIAQMAETLSRIERATELHSRYFALILKLEVSIMSELTDGLDRAESAAQANTAADDAAEALLVSISDMLKKATAGNTTDPALVARAAMRWPRVSPLAPLSLARRW